MKTLRKLRVYMGKRQGLLPLALILSALSSLISMLPLLMIWLIIRHYFGLPALGGHEVSVSTYAWIALGSAVGSIMFYFVALMFSHLAAFRVETDLRKSAMQRVVSMPLGFFDKHTSGRVRKIIDDNVSITHGFLAHQLPDLAGTFLMPLATLVLIFLLDWQLGLACMIPIVAAMAIMSSMMGGKGKHFMDQYMNALEDMNTEAVEYVRGIPVVKVFQQSVFTFKSFYNSIMKYKNMVSAYTRMWRNPMSAYTILINGFAFFLVPMAILIIPGSSSSLEVILNLFFYILITPVFGMSIMRSMHLNQAMGQAEEAIQRIENLYDTAPLTQPKISQNLQRFDIQFKGVSFRYPGSNAYALQNVNLNIPSGSTLALVGASGSGKTTIARLIPRFWDVDKGSVCLGGVDVRNIGSHDLMQHISFVFQNTKLFKTSLYENIKYGKPDARREDVDLALNLAQCREIIDRLPKGLDTLIGAKGSYLSGGEQQRIALARAILKDAPVIVLDEATAFADPENEDLIQQALESLTHNKTVVMIAHRLSTVKDIEHIAVVHKGSIVESGNHEELLRMKGRYARMWEEYQQSVKWTFKEEESCYV